MQIIRHPFVARDLIGLVDHIVQVTGGDVAAADRRLDEVDALISSIAETPSSGVRLGGALSGWLVRHGGTGQKLTVVFRQDTEGDRLFIALIAFGGRNWIKLAAARRAALE